MSYHFGQNNAVATSTETIWAAGGAYTFQTSSQAIEIVSTNAADASAGTGARTVQIIGLDADYNPIEETVTLNGTTAVDLTLTYLRVTGYNAITVGSGGVNTGSLTIQLDGAGAAMGFVPAGDGLLSQAVATVPGNRPLTLTEAWLEAAGGVTASLVARDRNGIESLLWRAFVTGNKSSIFTPTGGIPIPARTDIRLDGVSGTSIDTTGWFALK